MLEIWVPHLINRQNLKQNIQMFGGQLNRHFWCNAIDQAIEKMPGKLEIIVRMMAHVHHEFFGRLVPVSINSEKIDFGGIPATKSETKAACGSENPSFIGNLGVNPAATFVIVGQASIEFEKGRSVFFNIGLKIRIGKMLQAIAGKRSNGFDLWPITQQAEMKGQIINAPVDEWPAA